MQRFILAGLCMAFCVASAIAQTSAPVASPFDKDDPEIATIKSLDWKNANFEALAPQQQVAALNAMNRALSMIGGKADARLDLLIAYVDKNELGVAFEEARQGIADLTPVTYADLKKVGAAYLKTPVGQAKLGSEFADASPSMVKSYLGLYDKSAQREFAEAVESRLQVRELSLFLESQGKLDDFKKWATVERQRQQEEFEKKQAADKAQKQAEADERRAAAQAAAEARRQQDLAAQQMQYAIGQQEQSYASQPQQQVVYNNDSWWGEGNYAYGAAYYYNNAYRGAVRDRAQNAYQRWQSNRPVNLPARGGGGGIRGGGRR